MMVNVDRIIIELVGQLSREDDFVRRVLNVKPSSQVITKISSSVLTLLEIVNHPN